jgi:UDP-N-acetylglucosamine 2-epimerase
LELQESDMLSLATITDTKQESYKQALIMMEAQSQGGPSFIINMDRHFDDALVFGLKEFSLGRYAAYNLQI